MKTFTALVVLSMVCPIYAQSYGMSSYDPYGSYNGIGLLTGSRLGRSGGLSRLPLIGTRRLARGRLIVGTRGLSRLGLGRRYRPVSQRYIDTSESYIPRRRIYSTSYAMLRNPGQ
ncbi:uncharacterized protein LOC128555574 [Mercenaria mercenaria]|uniref:uncharacterized protein LOC128555574 n=1 Tax=Mercenaria mercenaria TaxID=6596 RepID=UPI00234EDBAB|nr:uncharacterized protein LOC128555574 [Mercenaria mercenaria]